MLLVELEVDVERVKVGLTNEWGCEGDDADVDEEGVDVEELVLVGEGLVDKEGVGLLPVELSVVLQGQGVDVVDEEGVDVLLV